MKYRYYVICFLAGVIFYTFALKPLIFPADLQRFKSIYNRELTATEVAQIYKDPTHEPNEVSYKAWFGWE